MPQMVDPNEGVAFPVPEGGVKIGRDDENAVQLPAAGVSRHHAVITQARDGWHIKDLGSSNGTFVNGKRVGPGKKKRISDGDVIKIDMFELCFKAHGAGPTRLMIDCSDRILMTTMRNTMG